MIRRPPTSKRTDTRVPYTALCRSHRTGLLATEPADRAWGPVPQGGCTLLRVRGGCAAVRGQVVSGPDHEHAYPRRWIRSSADDDTDRRVIAAGAGGGIVQGLEPGQRGFSQFALLINRDVDRKSTSLNSRH